MQRTLTVILLVLMLGLLVGGFIEMAGIVVEFSSLETYELVRQFDNLNPAEFQWSPDGKRLAFRGNLFNSPTLSLVFVINADGTGLRAITPLKNPLHTAYRAVRALNFEWSSNYSISVLLMEIDRESNRVPKTGSEFEYVASINYAQDEDIFILVEETTGFRCIYGTPRVYKLKFSRFKAHRKTAQRAVLDFQSGKKVT